MNSTQEFDQSLGSDAQAVIGLASNFAEKEVRGWIESLDGKPEWAGDLIRRASSLGLAGIEIPVDRGGHGLPYGARARVAQELAKADFAFAFAFINHHNATMRIAVDGSKAAHGKYLPEMLAGKLIGCTAMSELDAGSDFSAIRTFAKRVNGGWLLDGEKRWIANARGGEIALVFAQTDRPARRPGIACFIVDLRGVGCSRLHGDQIEGLALAGIGGFRLEAYHAPDCDLLYPPGEGFSQAMAGVNKARTHIAAMAGGVLFASLSAATARAASRMAFGRPIWEQQGLRWSLVDVSMTLEIMQMLTIRAAHLIHQGSDEAVVASAMAKKFAAEQCLNGVSACIQAFGAAGLVRGNQLSSRLAAAKALCMADGTTEMMNERIGASLRSRFTQGKAQQAMPPCPV